MKRSVNVALIVSMLLLLAGAQAGAQEKNEKAPEDQAQVFDLGEILVTTLAIVEEKLGTQEVVDTVDFENKNADSAADILDYVPGLHMSVGAKDDPGIYMRGISLNGIAVMMDGIPLYNPYYGDAELKNVPIQMVGEIQITKGVASPLAGPNAVGGAINIISRKPGNKPLTTLNYEFGEDDFNSFTINHADRAGHNNRFYYWITLGRQYSSGFHLSRDFKNTGSVDLPTGQRERTTAKYEKEIMSLKVGREWGQDNELAFSFNHVRHPRVIPAQINNNRARQIGWNFISWNRWTFALDGKFRLSPAFLLKTKVYNENYLNTLDMPNFTSLDKWDDESFGLILSGFWDVTDNNQINANMQVRRDHHTSYAVHDVTGALQSDDSYTQTVYSLGLEHVWRASDRAGVTWGASLDRQESGAVGPYTYPPDTKDAVNPVFGIRYKASSRDDLALSAGRKSQFPSMIDRYNSSGGNPKLKVERSLNTEASWTRKLSRDWNLGLNVFRYDVEDKITRLDLVTVDAAAAVPANIITVGGNAINGVRDRNGNILEYVLPSEIARCEAARGVGNCYTTSGAFTVPRTALNQNLGEVEIQGVELQIKGKVNKWMDMYISHGYTTTDVTDPQNPNTSELNYTPKNQTMIGLNFNWNPGWTVNVDARIINDVLDAGVKINDYTLYNLRIARDFASNYQAYLNVNNVLDEDYAREAGFNQAGRTFTGGIKASY